MGSKNSDSLETEQILIEGNSNVRILILNRPWQLNALSHQMAHKKHDLSRNYQGFLAMISGLLEKFLTYEEDPNVKLLIVKGQGRAFCSGGDVASVARLGNEGRWDLAAKFFWEEYVLNFTLATNMTPQVSLLNGIVMGGGAGVSIHGRFRVVTEKTVFATPETSLGLFPDVGATYFLPRLPGFLGEYVGLTGTRLDGAEMLACGLATHFVFSSKLASLEEELSKVDTSNPDIICTVIDRFSQKVPLKEGSAFRRLNVIDKFFSQRTVEEILSALEKEAANGADAWLSATIKSLKAASPTSLKISLRSIREGRLQGLDQCLIQEYRMVCHVLRKKFSKDFYEGCRAILIDKDRNPKWEPSKLELVSEKMVDHYFSKVDEEKWRDLELPRRKNTKDIFARPRL